MNELEAQVEKGQAALGRLIRQFLAVNDYRHVQFMQMAHALTGVRWLHSSQISTLKRGAAKNLTGFPLYSVALVNRRIWEVNTGAASAPPGTRQEDWLGRSAMVTRDGRPLDIGDLWRIYFGEIEAPLMNLQDEFEIDDDLAALISNQIGKIFSQESKNFTVDQTSWLDSAIAETDIISQEKARKIKGVFLGVVEMSADEIKQNVSELASILSKLTGESYDSRAVYELFLETGD